MQVTATGTGGPSIMKAHDDHPRCPPSSPRGMSQRRQERAGSQVPTPVSRAAPGVTDVTAQEETVTCPGAWGPSGLGREDKVRETQPGFPEPLYPQPHALGRRPCGYFPGLQVSCFHLGRAATSPTGSLDTPNICFPRHGYSASSVSGTWPGHSAWDSGQSGDMRGMARGI